MSRLIIFDCDGVLRSFSWPGIFKAYQDICLFAGRNPDKFFTDLEGFQRWFSFDWQENMQKIGVKKWDYPEVIRIFHQIHDPLIETFPWVENTMRELATKNTLAVLSASSAESIRKSLAGCAQYISVFVGSEDVRKVKPHPQGVHLIMEHLQMDNALIIGDAEPDIIAGQRAGIQTGAVDWGIRRIGIHLAELEPDFIFHHPEDLLFLRDNL